MTLDEALKELGIDRDAGADGARRAYLRLLKTRKPEVDREGFMRLREAYELAKEVLPHFEVLRAFEAKASAGVVFETAAVADSAADSAAATDSASATATATDSASASASATDSASASATASATDSASASAADSDSAPDSAPPSPPPPPPSIDDLLAANKFKTAANQLAQRYRDAARGAEFVETVPSPYKTLRLLLTLHEKNNLAEAKALQKGFADWLTSTGSSARIVAGELAVLWVVARELSALSKSFPVELRRIIARAALAGDLALARREASDFRFDQPLLAESAALDLHAHAPSLANMLASVLVPPTPAQRQESSNASRIVWVIIPIFMAIVRLIGAVGSSSSTPSPYSYNGGQYLPPPRPTSTQVPLPTSNSEKPKSIWDLVDAGAHLPMIDAKKRHELVVLARSIEHRAKTLDPSDENWIARRALNVRIAIEDGACLDAMAESTGLVGETRRAPPFMSAALDSEVKELDQLLSSACAKATAGGSTKDGGKSP